MSIYSIAPSPSSPSSPPFHPPAIPEKLGAEKRKQPRGKDNPWRQENERWMLLLGGQKLLDLSPEDYWLRAAFCRSDPLEKIRRKLRSRFRNVISLMREIIYFVLGCSLCLSSSNSDGVVFDGYLWVLEFTWFGFIKWRWLLFDVCWRMKYWETR